jgi:hypothetical protein
MLGVGLYVLHSIGQKMHQESLEKQVEAALWRTQEAIESHKRSALSLALVFSKSPSIKEAYRANDRQGLIRSVEAYLENMQTLGGLGPVDVQFHTESLHAWVRSWDKDSFGMPLAGFRKGLVHVKEQLKPHVSIELGKRLNIKAIAPIVEEKFLGSVEVILGFEEIKEQLLQQRIEMIVLLHKTHLDIAEWESSKHRLGEFVLVSDACPCGASLEKFAQEGRFGQGFLEDEQRVYGFLPLYNVDAIALGFLGVALNRYELEQGRPSALRPFSATPARGAGRSEVQIQ